VREIIATIRVMAIWQCWMEEKMVEDGLKGWGWKSGWLKWKKRIEDNKLQWRFIVTQESRRRIVGYQLRFRLQATSLRYKSKFRLRTQLQATSRNTGYKFQIRLTTHFSLPPFNLPSSHAQYNSAIWINFYCGLHHFHSSGFVVLMLFQLERSEKWEGWRSSR
jgi:hypothetical protein